MDDHSDQMRSILDKEWEDPEETKDAEMVMDSLTEEWLEEAEEEESRSSLLAQSPFVARSLSLDSEDVEMETILEVEVLEEPFSWLETKLMSTIQPPSSMPLEEEEEILNPSLHLNPNALALNLEELAMIAEEVEEVVSFTSWPPMETTDLKLELTTSLELMEDLASDARTKPEESMESFNTDTKAKFAMASTTPTMDKSMKVSPCFLVDFHHALMESPKLAPMAPLMIPIHPPRVPLLLHEPLDEQAHLLEHPIPQPLHQIPTLPRDLMP